MLEMAFIREREEWLQQIADEKGMAVSIRQLLAIDDERRALLHDVEQLRQQRNQTTEQMKRPMEAHEREQLRAEAKQRNQLLHARNEQLQQVQRQWEQQMLLVPNVVAPDVPKGTSDADNIAIRYVGDHPVFDFSPRDHVELGEMHRMIDMKRGVKIGGSRHYVLTGDGAHLHRAVQQLAIDVLERDGFQLMDVPTLVRGETLQHTGFFPHGAEQTFKVEGGDHYLIGTSEVSLVSYYKDEVIDVSQPVRLAAATTCYRQEIGSAGKDVHGLYRVHQFAKVEQVVFCRQDVNESNELLEQMTRNAETILQLLELPYRVVAVCIGDMSQKTYKQYDIETWMPSRDSYGETHSASNLLDFQARRARIRYRDGDGTLRYCYTLNNTAVATPRILIPLLENHQQEDGSIRIPAALRPYMQGKEAIRL